MSRWLSIERHGPVAAGIVAAGAHFIFLRGVHPDGGEIFGNVTNVSGIAVGFLATAQGLLVSLSDTQIVRQLKQLKMFKPLLAYFSTAIHLALLLCVASLILSVVPVQQPGLSRFCGWEWAFSLWLGLVSWTAFASFRVIHLFGKVVHEA